MSLKFRKTIRKRFLSIIFLFMVGLIFTQAQMKSIDMLSDMKKFSGFFNFYWDEKSGNIWLEIDKFDHEFLYIESLSAGLGSNVIGLDRNQLGETRVVTFYRVGPKILMIQPNYAFRAGSGDPLEKRGVEEAFAQSVIWGFTIESEADDRVFVDFTPFLMQDAHNSAERLRRGTQRDYRVDPSRSAIYLPGTKNFPKNSEFEVLLTFISSQSVRDIGEVVPTGEAVTLRQHLSLVELPEPGYKPRMYDPRSMFSDRGSYRDLTAPIDQPVIKRFISRHRLQKKDPSAAISEAVEPIVYYIDRAAPEPIRTALLEGASWWNQAFEAIGYKNAFQVRLLPEDADALDIRFNMVNWVPRADRGWSYGSSVTDPRTGEIIKGHVVLGALRIRQDFLIASGLVAAYEKGKEVSPAMEEMSLARIRQLSCHEVGHTLGLGHNYAASVNERASVMDYPHPLVKIKSDGSLDLRDAYAVGIGEWDKVAIAYGYQDFPESMDEEKELRAILDRAFARGMYFLPSQDAGPGSAHPLANTWDNGKHPVDELERVMKIRKIALMDFSEKRIPLGSPLATLEELLVPVYLFHRYQVEAAASMIGGVYYYHTIRGGSQDNPEIVSPTEQRRALNILMKTLHPEFLAVPPHILELIPPQPPGYRQTQELFPGNTGQTFDPLGAAESAAVLTVREILHPERAARLVDFHSRDNEYPGLSELIDRLLAGSIKADEIGSVDGEIQRTVNSVVLYHLLGLAGYPDTSSQVRAVMRWKINELKQWLHNKTASIQDEEWKAHYFNALYQIDLFEKDPDKFKLQQPFSPPPGAPIGMSVLER